MGCGDGTDGDHEDNMKRTWVGLAEAGLVHPA